MILAAHGVPAWFHIISAFYTKPIVQITFVHPLVSEFKILTAYSGTSSIFTENRIIYGPPVLQVHTISA